MKVTVLQKCFPAHKARTIQGENATPLASMSRDLTFTVHRYRSFSVLANVQETLHDAVRRGAAIYKEHVIMLEAGVREAPCVVDLLVQPDDDVDVLFPEVREVGLRGVQWVACNSRTWVHTVLGNIVYRMSISKLFKQIQVQLPVLWSHSHCIQYVHRVLPWNICWFWLI